MRLYLLKSKLTCFLLSFLAKLSRKYHSWIGWHSDRLLLIQQKSNFVTRTVGHLRVELMKIIMRRALAVGHWLRAVFGKEGLV